MIRECIKEASTIEEAKAAASAMLGVDEGSLQFEILQEPQKKTLGLFGGNPAKVRAFYEPSGMDIAKDYLSEMLTGLGVGDFTVQANAGADNCTLVIDGEDLGFVIGRRGETLDAIQYLVGLVANKAEDEYYRVMVNVGDYREKREESLTGLAKKIANQASRTGRRISLEPMNPYERRIIHSAVQEVKGATSWSVGSDSFRHVVVGPSDDNPVKNKPQRSSRRNDRRSSSSAGDSRRSDNRSQKKSSFEKTEKKRGELDYTERHTDREVRTFVPRNNPLPYADGATPPSKTQSDKEDDFTLYGRIDL